jgi:hypothetical protein
VVASPAVRQLLLAGRGLTPSALPTQPTSPLPDFWLIGDSAHYQDTGRTTPAVAEAAPLGSGTDAATTGPYHPSQSTDANRPTLALSVFKGHAGIKYSTGHSQNLTHATAPLANALRAKGTLIACFRSDEASAPGGSVFSTTQDQLGFLSDGRFTLNTAAVEYGTMNTSAAAAMRSPLGGQLIVGVYDGTQSGNAGRLRLWRNLVEETLTYTGTISATTYAGGQTLYLGREAAGSGWAHTALEILFFRGVALTTAQRQAWENWLAYKYFTKTTKQLVVSGDSNAVGSPTNTANPWPKRVTDALGWNTVSNNSTVGFKLSQGSASPNLEKRDDWYTVQPYMLSLGTNDLAVDHASLATLQGLFNTAKGKVATNGRFPLFAPTVPMAGANIAGADETTRQNYNAWLLSNSGSGYRVVDVATALGDPTGAGDANFEGDDLHLSNTGHTVYANAIITEFQAAGY